MYSDRPVAHPPLSLAPRPGHSLPPRPPNKDGRWVHHPGPLQQPPTANDMPPSRIPWRDRTPLEHHRDHSRPGLSTADAVVESNLTTSDSPDLWTEYSAPLSDGSEVEYLVTQPPAPTWSNLEHLENQRRLTRSQGESSGRSSTGSLTSRDRNGGSASIASTQLDVNSSSASLSESSTSSLHPTRTAKPESTTGAPKSHPPRPSPPALVSVTQLVEMLQAQMMEPLQQQLDQLTRERDDLARQLRDTKSELQMEHDNWDNAQAKIKEMEGEMQRYMTDYRELLKESAEMDAELASREATFSAEVSSLKTKLADAEAELVAAKQTAERLKASANDLNSKLGAVRKENWKLIQEAGVMEKKEGKHVQEIAAFKAKLSDKEAEILIANQTVEKRKAASDYAKGQLEVTRKEKEELVKTLAERETKEGALRKEVIDLKATVTVKEAALAKAANTAEVRHKVLGLARAELETLRKEKEAQSKQMGEQRRQHEAIITKMTENLSEHKQSLADKDVHIKAQANKVAGLGAEVKRLEGELESAQNTILYDSVPKSHLEQIQATCQARAADAIRRSNARRRQAERDPNELLRDQRSADRHLEQLEHALDSVEQRRYHEAQQHRAEITRLKDQLVLSQKQAGQLKRRAVYLEKDNLHKKRKMDNSAARRSKEMWELEVGVMQSVIDVFIERRKDMGEMPVAVGDDSDSEDEEDFVGDKADEDTKDKESAGGTYELMAEKEQEVVIEEVIERL